MLNEKQEYRLYLTADYGDLLRRDNLTDCLSGLRPVLTVLARGFLENCRESGVRDPADLHRYTIAFLKVWLLGEAVSQLEDGTDEALREAATRPLLAEKLQAAADACLLRHLDEQEVRIKSGKFVANDHSLRLRFLLNKIHSWSDSLFYSYNEQSLNAIYFKAIVADALYQGPLTDLVLQLREGDEPFFGLQGNFGYSRHLCLLGIVALYLQRKPSFCQSTPIVMAHFSNYLKKPTRSKDKSERYKSVSALLQQADYRYDGRPLFSLHHLTPSCVKLAVNADWLRHYDLRLVSPDEPLPSGYCRFDDRQLRPDRT